jgi:ribose/xylose/arabinose/galactoside ABC-type transport system permease subunit
VALLCGAVERLLVAVLGLQPIVATLILMVAGRGLAQLITTGRSSPSTTSRRRSSSAPATGWGCRSRSSSSPGSTAWSRWLLHRTALGLFIQAVGQPGGRAPGRHQRSAC